jgi:hypothetical protein
MALWSLFVEVGDNRYSTQVSAADAKGAIQRFLATPGLRQTLASLSAKGWPPSFSMGDVYVLTPMEGLTNMYLCQLGLRGKYVSVILARTVSRRQA